MQRRGFLKGAVAGGAGLLLVSPRAAFTYQANERLHLAIVGTWGYCSASFFVPHLHTLDNVSLTALCDVDLRKAANVYRLWQDRASGWPHSERAEERVAAGLYQQLAKEPPPLYRDFRKMLEDRDRHIDAVVCATPDHTHAIVSAASLRAGKHILAEKPLTIRAEESRALRALAAERGHLATSMGNQGTGSPQFRRGVELIRQGTIGPVEEVHIWFVRGGRNHLRPPQGSQPVPPELEWDLWLGPVAWRAYHPGWISRNSWRDTTYGELGNMGPHDANMAFLGLNVCQLWAAGVAEPPVIRVQAEVSEINRLSFPRWERIRWSVPARGEMPPVVFTWHHGPTRDFAPGSRPMLEEKLRGLGATQEQIDQHLGGRGCLIAGRHGAILAGTANAQFVMLPARKFDNVQQARPETLPASPRGHYQEWIAACRGGPMPMANFGYATVLNEFLTLGQAATAYPDTPLEYDVRAGRFRNHAAANQWTGYAYRRGWSL